MKRKLLLVVFLFLIFSLYSQTNIDNSKLKEISFSELLNEMIKENDSVYTLKNAFVKFDKKKDERYSLFEYRFKEKEYPADTIHIHKTINFNNVHFEKNNNVYNYGFINFFFHKTVNITNSLNITTFNCTFNNNFKYTILNTTKTNSLWLKDCVFNKEVKINDISDTHTNITLVNNIFNKTDSDDYRECLTNSLLLISIANTNYFAFSNNTINYENASFLIQVSGDVSILENNIQSNNWNYLFLDNLEKLTFINNLIETDLLFEIDKMKSEYNVQWPLTTNHRIIPLNYIFSNNDSPKELGNIKLNFLYNNNKVSDVSYYKNELTQLSKFHSYFKDFHDRQSANDVYIKIKDLETERLAYLFDENKSFENFFELIINRFLKRFSNYGTSLSKIVMSSFNIILFFAFLFLFSTNSWNKLNLDGFNKKIKQSINYFTSNINIIKAFEINQNRIIENNSVKTLLIKNRKQIPKVFSFFTLLLLTFQTKLSQIKLSLWNYLDIVKDSWSELSVFKRVFNSILLLGLILAYFLSKIASILLNSITLSINSFTTLGFGEIPIKGIGRYLAIIEGFIGWVFLTLFSVTLISQLLS